MAEASHEFRTRLEWSSSVVVADHGMVSAANLQTLQDEQIEYVITERLRRSTANDVNAREALQDLARVQRAPLYRAGITVTNTSAPSEQHERLVAAIGAPIPERHTAA